MRLGRKSRPAEMDTANYMAESSYPLRQKQKLRKLVFAIRPGLLTICLLTLTCGSVISWLDLWALDPAQEASQNLHEAAETVPADDVDFSLWSPKRVQAYKASLLAKLDRPLAVLRIPRLRITAPVLEGTDDLTLNRGVGRIGSTAQMGSDGNVGIAGHRDGFFRALKDIVRGDSIEVVTPQGQDLYIVDRIDIVTPRDVSVIGPSKIAGITLITCYPFYHIGDAPQRYIVHASLKERRLQLRSETVLPANPGMTSEK